jgi:hypothetical protein
VTVKVAEIPPPEHDCATDEDLERLAVLIPEQSDPARALRVERIIDRVIESAAYCEMAERRLR